jgi:hypothetical protein
MKKIPLTQRRYALVDDEDFDFLNQWEWFVSAEGYAVRNKTVIDAEGKKKQKTVWMHRIINNTPAELKTDHIDGDRLDNRKENLRSVTQSENSQNSGKWGKNKTSKYKGVNFHKRDGIWQAAITANGVRKHIGQFQTEEAAALAYNEIAKMMHGEFAKLNKVVG